MKHYDIVDSDYDSWNLRAGVFYREVWTCPTCGHQYDNQKDAQECLAKGYGKIPGVKVGDIVIISRGFGWFDGDPKWISNPEVGTCKPGGVSTHRHTEKRPCPNDNGNCSSRCCCYEFYYVVVGISRNPTNPHSLRVHLLTKAMTNGYKAHTAHMPYNVLIAEEDPPEHVVITSKELL